jgi:tetratricopeptide (TPR) repeat protein
MLRACLLSIGLSVIATSALAATDIETCRDNQADAAARLTACNAAIADDKVTGKPKAFAHWYIGDSLSKKRDYNGAIVAFNKALEIDPENVTVLNSRGIAYGNKGDDERALADYDSCLKLRPNFASAHNNRGIIFMRKGDFEQAYNEFSDAIRLNVPQNRFINLYNRGRVQTLRKQYDSALADFAQARQINADGVQVPVYRCITYTEMGKFDEALADCNEVLAKFPKAVYTLASRGNLYLAKGDLDAALRDYNEAIGINPNAIRAYVGRGQLYERRRDLTAARYDYRSASAALTKVDDDRRYVSRAWLPDRYARAGSDP